MTGREGGKAARPRRWYAKSNLVTTDDGLKTEALIEGREERIHRRLTPYSIYKYQTT